ncbi:MAG TPA: hypothetical protein VK502_02075, partial [Candidatus Saccharimonadales bacterium]|nr:hypothetical protein [Candidatus Saccharimonadales bacterium]
MAAPTFIAAYNTSYTTTGTTKTLSVTTQAGDTLVVYGGGNTVGASTPLTLTTPTGNSVSFSLLQSIAISSKASAYLWSAVDAAGGTSWTLSCSASDASTAWGFSCAVFRNANGTGASDNVNGNGAPSLSLGTTQANSAIVVFNHDWAALDGASRTWRTINSITPTSGNGLELTYSFNASTTTAYGAYYDDVGATGSKTVGLSAPGSQSFSLVTVEVLGIAGVIAPTVTTQAVAN